MPITNTDATAAARSAGLDHEAPIDPIPMFAARVKRTAPTVQYSNELNAATLTRTPQDEQAIDRAGPRDIFANRDMQRAPQAGQSSGADNRVSVTFHLALE